MKKKTLNLDMNQINIYKVNFEIIKNYKLVNQEIMFFLHFFIKIIINSYYIIYYLNSLIVFINLNKLVNEFFIILARTLIKN